MRISNPHGFAFLMALLALVMVQAPSRCDRSATSRIFEVRPVIDKVLSSSERVEKLLRFLQEEMRSPVSPDFNDMGGPMDSGYVQENVMSFVSAYWVKGLNKEGIRANLARRLNSTPESDQALRDRLTIMLGFAGDRTVVPRLMEILEKDPEGFMRSSAARALCERADPQSIPALKRVMASDTYTRLRWSDCGEYDDRTMIFSPVRDGAADALKKMGVRVPKDVEVLEPRYGVQCIESLLQDSRMYIRSQTIHLLGKIKGKEAEKALQSFIDTNGTATDEELKKLVTEAQKTLGKLQGAEQEQIAR